MMAVRNGYNTPASRMPDRPMLVINDPADFVPDIIQPKEPLNKSSLSALLLKSG
jgi:hypothetical protein